MLEREEELFLIDTVGKLLVRELDKELNMLAQEDKVVSNLRKDIKHLWNIGKKYDPDNPKRSSPTHLISTHLIPLEEDEDEG